jgi:thiamine-phosphate pyrophosphorylase
MSLPQTRPLLYLITNRAAFRPPQNSGSPDGWRAKRECWERQLEAIAGAARAGCQLIQIREKDLDGRALGRATREAIAAARPWGARILVNDRLDVALATGADGVHLRTTSLVAGEVRRAAERAGRSDLLIGVSTHGVAEARMAAAGGADFIVTGPVYETASKIGYGPPLGLEGLAGICRAVEIPVIGLGGIGAENFRPVLAAGAAGIAGIALFQGDGGAAAIESLVARLRRTG